MALDAFRAFLMVFSIILTLGAAGLSFFAVLTPTWQTVYLEENNSVHEHGLWLDCSRVKRINASSDSADAFEALHCTYKFDFDKYYGNFDAQFLATAEVGRHRFAGWHKIVLVLLGLSLLTAFFTILIGILCLVIAIFTLCFDVCVLCFSPLYLMFIVTTFIAALFAGCAELCFYIFANAIEIRFIQGKQGQYEQRLGFAFFMQMCACIVYLLAFLVAIVSSRFVCCRSKYRHHRGGHW